MSKISVVVPSYNQGQFIEETLLSIINQDHPDVEIIVIDGGSTDDTVSVIRKYESSITYWISEKDKGQSDAINKGFARATGDIITWLCSDDLFTPGALRKVDGYFGSLPEQVGLIHGGVQMFRGDTDLEIDFGYEDPSTERNISGMAFSQPSAFLRKKYLDIIGGRVSEVLHFGMDFDLFSRLAAICEFHQVTDIFARYRLHDSSKTVSQQDKFIIDWSRVFINFCKNAGWNDIVEKLKQISPFTESFDYYYEFPFVMKGLDKIDRERALFYHLCYQTRSLFASGRIEKSRKIVNYLKKNYPMDLLKQESRMSLIMSRLMLPSSVLMLIRKIRGKA